MRTASDTAVTENVGVVILIGLTIVAGVGIYAWVSGWTGSGDADSAASRTAALTSTGIVRSDADGDWKNFTVTSASGSLRYAGMSVRVEGLAPACSEDWVAADTYRVWRGADVLACGAGGRAPDVEVRAGDVLEIRDDGGGLSGKGIELVDVAANRVILQADIV